MERNFWSEGYKNEYKDIKERREESSRVIRNNQNPLNNKIKQLINFECDQFSISYPQNFIAESIEQFNGRQSNSYQDKNFAKNDKINEESNTPFVAYKPNSKRLAAFCVNINKMSKDDSLENFVSYKEAKVSKEYFCSVFTRQIADMPIFGRSIIDGYDAHEIIFTTNIEGKLTKQKDIYVCKDGYFYILSYISEHKDFDAMMAVGEKMVSTFRFK